VRFHLTPWSLVVGAGVRGELIARICDGTDQTVRDIINGNVGGAVEVILTDELAIYPWANLEYKDLTAHFASGLNL
jgi:hypothetical protein